MHRPDTTSAPLVKRGCGRCYPAIFVMELVEGCSLSQVPTSDFGRVVEIGSQICDALDHAHTHSIVHRDLKPDNVLVSGAGESAVQLERVQNNS